MKTQIAILFFLFSSLGTHLQYSKDTMPQLDALLEAFKKKKTDSLKAYLVEGYSIKTIPAGYEDQVLPQLISAYPEFDSYTISEKKKEAKGTRVFATFNAKNFPLKVNVLIDKNQKISELNIIDEEYSEVKMGAGQ